MEVILNHLRIWSVWRFWGKPLCVGSPSLWTANTFSRNFVWTCGLDIAPCNLLEVDQRFKSSYYLHHQGSTLVWNVAVFQKAVIFLLAALRTWKFLRSLSVSEVRTAQAALCRSRMAAHPSKTSYILSCFSSSAGTGCPELNSLLPLCVLNIRLVPVPHTVVFISSSWA